MESKNKIVILGAGYGGVQAAKILSKKYKKDRDVEITLIDKNPIHTLMTELHEVAGGRVEADSVQVDLRKIFYGSRVKVITEEVRKVDVKKQILTTDFSEYKYDYLVLGTGSEPAYFGVPGVKEHGFSLWSLEDALKIREHIEKMFKAASKERNEQKRQAMLTFAVAGAGFTGIEMVGELIEWKKKLCRDYNVDVNDVKLIVIEALGRILNILDDKMATKAEKYMTKNKVEILKNAAITEVTSGEVRLKDGRIISTRTLIWTCGVQGNSFASRIEGLSLNNRGRVNTNEFMQAIGQENVYVVGDAAFLEEGKSKGLPQIVEAALQTAETAAHNIIADISNSNKKAFKSNYHGFMVSIGSHYAVADVGGMKLTGFFATAMKHLVNLHYLFGVGGFYLIFRYLFHEFFDIKEKRSILGGHLSAKSPSWWLIPLRLFIGSMWVIEALKKLIGEETWTKASGLGKITSGIGADSWFRDGNIKLPFSWLLDGTASASVVENTTSSGPTPILKHMPGFFEAIMKIMIPNAEVAIWFQRIVVCTELSIGLALIVGLFTWLASAASAFLVVNFILSAMAGYDILWYFFGAIALMSGAGRSFGLDYFVMPWFGKVLSNFWLGKQKPVYKTGNSVNF